MPQSKTTPLIITNIPIILIIFLLLGILSLFKNNTTSGAVSPCLEEIKGLIVNNIDDEEDIFSVN